jgi:hypothetical protein
MWDLADFRKKEKESRNVRRKLWQRRKKKE